MKETIIAPSVLAADFANLQRDIEMINNSSADLVSYRYYGWCFCSKYFMRNARLSSYSKAYKKTIDVHLMIVDHYLF